MKKGRLSHLKINTSDLLEVKTSKDAKINNIKDLKDFIPEVGVSSTKAGKLNRITFSPAKKTIVFFNSPTSTTNASQKTSLFSKLTNTSNLDIKPIAPVGLLNYQSEKEKFKSNEHDKEGKLIIPRNKYLLISIFSTYSYFANL